MIYVKNLAKAFSDHNLLIFSVRTKEHLEDKHDRLTRDRKNWNPVEFGNKVNLINWDGSPQQ